MHGIALFIGYCVLAVIALGVVLCLVVVLVESERERAVLQTIASLTFIASLAWLDIRFNNGALIGWLVIAAVISAPWLIYRAWKIRRHGFDYEMREVRKKLGYDD